MKYWIGVVSKDHVLAGVKDGIMQLGHGKKGPLARLEKGDGLIYYSSVELFNTKQPLQAFTAIGEVADDEIYEHPISESLAHYRRRVNYFPAKDVPIRPLIDSLSFIKNKTSWGYVFRFGLVEVPKEDFDLIKKLMTS